MYIFQSLLWNYRHGNESIPRKPPAEFVKGYEMKYSQQGEVNHAGRDRERGKAPMSPIADAACSAQQHSRADTDVVWLAGLPPPLSDPGKALPSHSAVRSCCTRGSACPCSACACAPQHGGESRQGFMLILGNLASFKFRISAQTHFFSPQQSLFVRTSIFSGNM